MGHAPHRRSDTPAEPTPPPRTSQLQHQRCDHLDALTALAAAILVPEAEATVQVRVVVGADTTMSQAAHAWPASGA